MECFTINLACCKCSGSLRPPWRQHLNNAPRFQSTQNLIQPDACVLRTDARVFCVQVSEYQPGGRQHSQICGDRPRKSALCQPVSARRGLDVGLTTARHAAQKGSET